MKNIKTRLTITAGACALASSVSASMGIATSYVGDMNNTADGGYGGVSYNYHVGTHEVTNSQYVSFLNAKGSTNANEVYNSNMNSSAYGGIEQLDASGGSSDPTAPFTYRVKAGMGQKPVNFVTFWDAARFTNWLTNGQGSGDTENGMYDLTAGGISGNTVTRNATEWSAGGVAVASEDEWYKAAYYKGGSTNAGYWDYAHQSDSIRTADANYQNSVGGGTLTDVGTYSDAASSYGTFDQGGNVWEWNDDIILALDPSDSNRGVRGGAFDDRGSDLQPWHRYSAPVGDGNDLGFRVSSLAPIPEPSSYAAMFGCLALTVVTMRRKGRRSL
jgi:formylglycine-generating enzyme required for sulfatase activity